MSLTRSIKSSFVVVEGPLVIGLLWWGQVANEFNQRVTNSIITNQSCCRTEIILKLYRYKTKLLENNNTIGEHCHEWSVLCSTLDVKAFLHVSIELLPTTNVLGFCRVIFSERKVN